MIDVLGLQFDNTQDKIQSVPGHYVWQDITGTVEVDGEKWNGRLLLFASPLGNLTIDSITPSNEQLAS